MDIVVISIANPILIGIYNHNILVDIIELTGKTSELLPLEFKKIHKKIIIDRIIYANGPGSYMAIKVAYIFLKTYCIVNKINFLSASGFEFNNNSPIKALGKKYFFRNKEDKDITIDFLNDNKLSKFELPQNLLKITTSDITLPSYNLPFV